jgi:hypothetical protein
MAFVPLHHPHDHYKSETALEGNALFWRPFGGWFAPVSSMNSDFRILLAPRTLFAMIGRMNRNQEFLDRESQIFTYIVEMLRMVAPRDWRRAVLELEAKYDPARSSLAMKHRYVNPISGQQLDDLPAELLLLTTELHMVYAQIDLVWCRCLVNLVFTRPNRLKSSKAVFEFDGEVPEMFTAPPELS